VSKTENGPKYFRDDTKNRVRQVKILPEDFPFRTFHAIAKLQFTTPEEIECVMITPRGRVIISPEYVKGTQALPHEQIMDHIIEAAVQMRRASSIHIIYKAPAKVA